jgi:hypothetical protein
MPQSPESLRVILSLLVCLAFVSAVALEVAGTPSERVWAAFGTILAALVGQHLDKPGATPAPRTA